MISIITDCIVIWSIERGAHTVMEPLAALSVAGTVVQFVQFASALFTGSRKIYNSTSGGSEENERLDIFHKAFTVIRNNKLFSAPLNLVPGNVCDILDLGCGTGIWVIDVAEYVLCLSRPPRAPR